MYCFFKVATLAMPPSFPPAIGAISYTSLTCTNTTSILLSSLLVTLVVEQDDIAVKSIMEKRRKSLCIKFDLLCQN
jgi:hypothetical protein